MNFYKKVVLVTGASSGIGAAVALKFAAHGASVAIVGRNEKKLKRISGKIQNSGNNALVINADVTVDDKANEIINQITKCYGKLDILINNVGIACFESILSANAMRVYDHVMTTNLRSAVKMTNLAAPYLIKTRGNIVNISSIASSNVINERNFSYCASKAGMDHFSRCTALELSKFGIRVNMVNPGPVNTDYMEKMNLNKAEQDNVIATLKNSSCLGKLVEPEEIADVVMFLTSDLARSITGSSHVIDNGLLLKSLIQF